MKRSCCPFDRSKRNRRRTARTAAKVGARLGAAAGARAGPFATGLASGLGGALGYLAGATLDGVEAGLDGEPVTDGGRSVGAPRGDTTADAVEPTGATGTDGPVVIDVTDERERSS